MSSPIGNQTFELVGRPDPDPAVWKLRPEDMIEINFRSPEGEGRSIIGNIEIDIDNSQLLILKGETRGSYFVRPAQITMRRPGGKNEVWDIRFGEAMRAAEPVPVKRPLDKLAILRWMILGWLLVAASLYLAGTIGLRGFLTQICFAGFVLMVPHAWLNSTNRSGSKSDKYRFFAYLGCIASITMIALYIFLMAIGQEGIVT